MRLSRQGGFTLVELLVSMVVLTALAGMLMSILNEVSATWTRSRKKFDNFAQGRALMSLMQRDLDNAVIRQDLAAFANKSFAFYSRELVQDKTTMAVAGADARALCYMTYGLAKAVDGKHSVLVRKDRPYAYRLGGSADAPAWQADSNTVPTNDTTINRQLCEGVGAFRYAFIQRDGSASSTFSADMSNPTCAVQVSIAVLGEIAENQIIERNQADALYQRLASIGTPEEHATQKYGWSPKTAWDRILDAHANEGKITRDTRTYIRTFERVIPLQNTPYRFLPTS